MAVVLGAMGSLAPKLFQLLHSEYELQKKVRKKLKFVYEEMESIRAALNKVAAVPWDQLDEQVKVWACQVRDASYDMEDVLDTFLVRVEGGDSVNRGRLKRAMKRMGGLFGKFKARRDIAGAIDDIEKQLQVVADRRVRYKIDDIVANPSPATTVDPRLSALYTKASRLVGIHEPRDELIEMLSICEVDGSSSEMKIISIVGFGGLGKTTLAKSVYDKVAHQFDCGAFVPVGRNPDPCKVLRDVLIDLINDADKRKNTNVPDNISSIFEKRYTGADLMSLDERQLINELHKLLEGKRYCIVIDDIWDKKTWEVIKSVFVDSHPRSRIIATTRNCKVSEEIGKVYRMKKLPESQSRELLYTITFGAEEKWPNNDELAVVSQKILRRCDGSPLAIITLGSLLAGKQISEWSNVYDSVGFGHRDDSQVSNMMKMLSFSYYDLPCHLRTCLLYLAAFPEDYSIHRGVLIWMWIAEGLVHTEDGKELLKEGESYFLELINRGMIQPIMGTYGSLNGCRVHDMVFHMIRNLSRDENFCAVQDSKLWRSQGSDVRRLAMHRAKLIQVNDGDTQKLRSFTAMYCGTDSISTISRFKLLRVLSLVGCRPLAGHLDTMCLGKLHHLRYLGLQWTPIRELPKDIGHLKFLQTLLLTGTGIEELPTSLRQLTKLMCLHADDKTRVPDWICELRSLVELVMNGAVDADKYFVKELDKLVDLRILCARITLQDKGEVRGFLEVLSNLEKIEVILLGMSKHLYCIGPIVQPSFVLHCNNLLVLQLRQLNFPRLPKWINPQALPKLCKLILNLSALYQPDVEIIGKVQNLCYLGLLASRAKMIIVGGGRFQNLRYFFATGLYQLECVQGDVQRLQEIWLHVQVRTKDTRYILENISKTALQAVKIVLDCSYCLLAEVEEMEAKLRHAVSIHPNRPTLRLTRSRGDEMLICSDSVMERQKKRTKRLWSQISHLRYVHSELWEEVVEMGAIKNDLHPTDAKNKLQGFHQQFTATAHHVKHKLLLMQDCTPERYPDANRMLENIKAMEEAFEILTVQYPRFAAMVDELRYLFRLQGAMAVPQVLNLNICVFDIKVEKLGLDLRLLEKISTLRGIKAHLMCQFCFPTEVEEVEAELRQAVQIHYPNNPPTLEIIRYAEDRMVNSDSDSPMLLASRLRGRINHQMELHCSMKREAVEMGELLTNLNLSDDTKNKGVFRSAWGQSEAGDRAEAFPREAWAESTASEQRPFHAEPRGKARAKIIAEKAKARYGNMKARRRLSTLDGLAAVGEP